MERVRRLALGLAAGTVLAAAAFAAGYALSSGPGRELLRRQVEVELSHLLRGKVQIEEIDVVVRHGLGLRGRGVSVYPVDDDGPGIFAEHASITLNPAALLVGRLSLSSLVVDDLTLRAVLRADDTWSFPPLQWLQNHTPGTEADRDRPLLMKVLAGAERAGRFLLQEERIASHIEVRNAQVLFEDRRVATAPGKPPQRYALRGIEGDLFRPWLSHQGNFDVGGTLSDREGREVKAEWTGSLRDGEVDLAVTADGLPLDSLDVYVKRIAPDADIAGSLSGSIRMGTAEPGFENVTVDVTFSQLVPTISLAGHPIRLEVPTASFSTRIEIDPQAARLVDAKFRGTRMDVDGEGTIERPVRSESKAHFEVAVQGLSIGDVVPVFQQLPVQTRQEISPWVDRIESGRVDRLALSGTGALSTWDDLSEGRFERLPPNFVVSLVVSHVTARLAENDRVVDGSFQADLAEDRLELRYGRGLWRGEPLPEVDLTIDGVSDFVGMQTASHVSSAQPLPGLPLVWDLLSSDEKPQEQATGGTRFLVDIDYLDHPILRWPLEDAHVIVQPTAYGTESLVTRGRWGGVPVRAHVAYVLQPEPMLTVGLEATGSATPDAGSAPAVAPSPRSETDWGRGRFQLEPAKPGDTSTPLLSRMRGNFVLTGSQVRLSDVDVALSSSTTAKTSATVDLGDAKQLGLAVRGHVEGASCDDLGRLAGLPAGFVTGRADIDADVKGEIEPHRNPWTGLAGTVTALAHKGEIRQSVPLAVAMAAATDGFNPFAKRETLAYDEIRANLRVADGSVSADRFELEGPVRIYATGSVKFADPPYQVDAVVGVFLLQRIRELLGKLPLVNLVLPGSKKGFVGAYFSVHGPWEKPKVTTMAMKSLKEELPALITKPFDLIQSLWAEQESEPSQQELEQRAAKKAAKKAAKEAANAKKAAEDATKNAAKDTAKNAESDAAKQPEQQPTQEEPPEPVPGAAGAAGEPAP